MKLSCIIIDDELFAIQQLEEYLAEVPIIGTIKSYSDPKLALAEIMQSEDKIDLLFTDIEMPTISGIDLIKQIRNKIDFLVLVSAHLNYAIDGYQINAQHFLLKPFDFNRFYQVVNQLTSRIALETPSIYVRQGKKYIKIQIQDIIAIEAALNYVKVHTECRVDIIYGNMKSFEKDLKIYDNFIRVSKSFIISKNHIIQIQGKAIYLKNQLSMTIGITYEKSLSKFFNNLPCFQKTRQIPGSRSV